MNSNKVLFFIIVFAACLTQFASDIYAPSLPAIAENLNTHINYVQWSMSIYLFGVAISQLIYGPISEGTGRKPPMIVGLIIMCAGSLVCLWAQTIEMVILGRLIQGCGAGACAALWRSVFRDVYSGEELAKYGSYLVIFVMFIIPAAPLLGGYFQEYFGWRANFVFMSLYSILAVLAVIFWFKETSIHHHPERLQASYIARTFHSLLTSRIFMGVTCAIFLSYGALFCWFTLGPVLLIQKAGLTPVEFGWLTALGGGSAYALAGILNGKLVTRLGIPFMMRLGFFIMICSGVILVLAYNIFGMNVWTIAIPGILFYFGSTFIWPNAFATAFTPFGKIAGYAGALYGFMQISGGAVISWMVSFLPSSQIILGITFILCSSFSWMVYEFSKKAQVS